LQSIKLVLYRLDHVSRATNVSSRSRLGWWSQRFGLELLRLVPIPVSESPVGTANSKHS